MLTFLTTVFVVSLLGSLHCAGMCGPLAGLATGLGNLQIAPVAWLHAFYHGGRALTYAALGVVAGALGAGVDWGGSLLGLQQVAALLAGAAMITIGLATLAPHLGLPRQWFGAPPLLQRIIAAGHRQAQRLTPLPRAGLIGLLTALLPCGWLYAFVIAAAGTGSALLGGLTMVAFWGGTVPILSVVGVGLATLRKIGPRLTAVAAVLMVALGVVTVVQRGALATTAFAREVHARTGDLTHTANSAVALDKLGETRMPCCDSDQ